MDDLNYLHDAILDTKAKIDRLFEFGPVEPIILECEPLFKAQKALRAFDRKVTDALSRAERAALAAID